MSDRLDLRKMQQQATKNDDYTPYVAVSGEGVRFGILSCQRCGAAVLIMPDEDNAGIHDDWHTYLNELLFDMSEPDGTPASAPKEGT